MLTGMASVILSGAVRIVAAMERSCTSFATMLTVGATAIGPVTVGCCWIVVFSVGYISSLFLVSGAVAGALASLNAH